MGILHFLHSNRLRKAHLFLLYAGLLLLGKSSCDLSAATLLKYGFETANPWAGMAGYFTTAGGSVIATPTWTTAGTIDTYGSGTASSGLQLVVNSSAATGNWSAGLDSGVLTAAANSRGQEFITLAFSLSASSAYPVRVKVESYDSTGTTRTGGLAALIFPAAPDFYQRYALDLDKMTPDGAGTFNPSATKIRLYFELDSTANGTGWPVGTAHTLKIDNVNYSTPKYYVKPASLGGSDSKSGLDEANALATVQAAANKTLSGDNIIAIMDGADFTFTSSLNGDMVNLTKAGSPDAWIVFKNYPGDVPVMKSAGFQVFKLTNTNTPSPTAASYIEIRGLTLRGYSYIDANGDRQIDAAYLSQVGQGVGPSNTNGIGVDGRNGTLLPRHLRFADNIIEFCTAAGIGSLYADRIAVENNIVRNNCWWMIYAGSGISYLQATDTEMGANNRMLVQGNIVSGNECMLPWYNNGTNFSDGNGIIIDSYSAGYTGRTIVQNNLSYNNGGSGIHVLKASNVDVVHNTAYFNSASPNLNYGNIFTQSTGTVAGQSVLNVRVTNNIMVARRNPTGVNSYLYNQLATTVATYDPTTIVHKRNIYAGGDVTPSLTGANLSDNTDLGRSYNATGLFLSPSLDPTVADFRLRSAAAARNYGSAVNYRSVLDLPLYTRSLTGITDSGAYQTVANLAYSPIFSPASGNYTTAQSVTLSSDTPSATIIYTTNGSTPTVDSTTGAAINGTTYTGSFSVSSSTPIVKAIAWKSGLATSPVSTATYNFTDLSAVPASLYLFQQTYNAQDNRVGTSLGTGIYTGTRVVQGLTRTPGAYVRFTTNGTDPTSTTGTPQEYKGYTITDHAAVRYRAFKTGRANSAVVSADITIRASMGNTADGSAATTIGANRIRFVRFQATDDFSAAYIFARIGGLTGGYRAAIYADASSVPGTRLAVSSLVSNPQTGWTAFPLSVRYSLAKNSYYWLAIWSDNANAAIYATTTGGTVRESTPTFSSSWPDPAGTTASVSGTANYAIYATNAPPNLAPVVSAGPDQLAAGTTPTLSGTVSNDGVPIAPGTVSTLWTVVSGPGTVAFGNAASVFTAATFSADGTYVLRLTATDALLSASDDVTIVSGTGNPNPAPTANVIYRETFGNSTAGNVRLNVTNIGWQQYTATSTSANVTNTVASGTYGGSSNSTGRPTDLDNVNAGTSASLTNGFGFNQNAVRALNFTTEYIVDRATYTPKTLSWYSQISSTATSPNAQSAAIRIAGQWYVSAASNNLTTVGSAATFSTTAGSSFFSVDFATADWRTLTTATNAPFNVGSTTATLPSGNIDAFGIYFSITNSGNTTRFDNFTFTATPVPPPALTPLQTWRGQYFTTTELANSSLEATLWGHLADPDRDGLTNLMEYALNSDPRKSTTSELPVVGVDEMGTLTLSFVRYREDLTYRVQGSSDLQNWETLQTNPGNIGESVIVPDTGEGALFTRFLRLNVILP